MTKKKYDFPVYGTQGGGLARSSGDQYVFVEVPNWGNFKVGDRVPEEWGIAAANEAARNEVLHEEFAEDEQFDRGMRDYIHCGHR